MSRPRAAIILAAGQGVRMQSSLPKALHKVGGRAMVDWAAALAEAVGCARTVVVVNAQSPALSAHVERTLGASAIAVQDPPRGTADAVRAAASALKDFDGDIVILYGDAPLMRAETIEMLCAAKGDGAGLAVLAFEAADPSGYGRLVQDRDGSLLRIVESRDAGAEEKAIRLCNSGALVADARLLFDLLGAVKADNSKGEFYLTDVFGLARARGIKTAVRVAPEAEVLGVNSRAELAAAEAAFQTRARHAALEAGVSMLDPATVYFSYDTEIAQDVLIEPHVFFGIGVKIEAGAIVHAFSHFEKASIGPNAELGPFARLRPGAKLSANVKIGNFVEVKNSVMGEGAKANHLTYLGDADVGAHANVGAGTITCNYDGFGKYRTQIGAGAFIGSNTALVAPVRIGDGAYTGAGSVITADVPADAIAIARGRQSVVEGWAGRFRERKKAEKAKKAQGK